MVNASKILIAVFAFCTIMTGCSKSDLTGNFKKEPLKVTNLQNGNQTKQNNQYKYFELPDKIQLIDKGKRLKMITADDNLYKQILDLTNERFNTNVSSLRCIVTPENLKSLENNELVLEFIYLGPKYTEFYNQFLPPIKQYVRLLMPLTNSVSKNLYIDDGKGSGLSPLSNLLPPDKLIDLVNKSNITNTSSSDSGEPW
ncbi:hypothetical protein [Candidatus Clostridium radicumherbarum]|uniref:Lipoprotein n=1 Tax=Candidatus Clostridium radicumherbarum TaxID=3381662 RepID=A0ABW8TQL7_9CLOT